MQIIAVATLLLLGSPVGPATADARGTEIPAGRDFGAGLTLTEPTPLATVLAEPERYEGKPVLVQGRVSDVCQKKGCWTILRDAEASVRIRFKDYGFFLPKDSTGDHAFAEGLVSVKTLSEDEQRHYEEESRNGDPDSVEGPKTVVSFIASGVRLLD